MDCLIFSFFTMVNHMNDIRNAEKVLGEIDYSLTEKQIKGKDYSRSLYIVKNVKKGDFF